MTATVGRDGRLRRETETVLEGIRGKVFLDRYALKGEDGRPLETSPEEMWERVAAAIAGIETTLEKRQEWTDAFYRLLEDFRFVPGGRILSGAGSGHDVTFYNCYVVGLGESPLVDASPDGPSGDGAETRHPILHGDEARPAFFKALGEMTDIMSRSGGVGMNLSALPPRGTSIREWTRGRNGLVRPTVALSVAHPDVGLLLDEKDGPNLAHLDIAVIITPDFERAVEEAGEWTPRWGELVGGTTEARALWDRLVLEDGKRVALLRPETPTLQIGDSREEIVDGAAEVAHRLFRGEGVVVDFSPLRPKGAYIKTVNGTSSGPVAWMYLYDAVARLDDGASANEPGVVPFAEIASTITGKTIQQGGSRRGALMIMLDDDHPDIEEFIQAKRIGPDGRPVMIEHANMSVCASDGFMEAVKSDGSWDLKWDGRVVKTVRARHIWDLICTAAWTTAEPGLVFMERAQKRSNTWYYENIRCVNPCGEQPLPPGGVCNLGALNLERYVDDDGRLDEGGLARDAAHATRFLDNVIDATPYFSELHVQMQREGTRRTGLGTMGLADALIKMRLAYGSAASLEAIDRIYGIIRDASYQASVDLAVEKGPFGRFKRDKYLAGEFIGRLPSRIRDGIAEHGIRNGVLLTQAPTGTTSLLAGVSSGIEPVFDFAMKRVDRTGEHILYHPLYQAWREAHPGEERPDYFVGAKDLTPEEHVIVQAKIQDYTDSSISKCVTGDTLVTTDRGMMPIGDLYAGEPDNAFRSIQLTIGSLGGPKRASAFYYGGLRQTVVIRLADGRHIKGTANHRLLTAGTDGLRWASLSELAEGDHVALKIGSQMFGTDVSLHGFDQVLIRPGYQKTIRVPATMTPLLAHFLGSWCGKGEIKHDSILITTNERPVLERLKREVEQLFDLGGVIKPSDHNQALTLCINNTSLCQFMRFTGCREGAEQKIVPWSVMQSGRDSVVAFLSGMYLDGYVTTKKIGMCLASRALIDQIQALLDNLGVQSWMTLKHNKVYDRGYAELNVHGREAQKLAQILTFDEAHKRERAAALLLKEFGASKSDIVPIEAQVSVVKGASTATRSRHHADSQELRGEAEGGALSWTGLRQLANDVEVPLTSDLRAVFEDNLHFREVVSVEDNGTDYVYDLTVPANEAFIANGIVNHNTANAPHDHLLDDVKDLYIKAYDLGCKGVTYYRDGSRDAVLSSVAEAAPVAASPTAMPDDGASGPALVAAPVEAAAGESEPAMAAWMLEGQLKRRPREMAGYTRNVAAPEGKVNITINSDLDGPLELFINVGRAGSDVAALAEALGRLISLQLRLPSTVSQGQRLRQVADQLRGIGGSRSIGFGKERVLSLPDAVAQAITRHLEEHPSTLETTVSSAQLSLPAIQLETIRMEAPPSTPGARQGLTGNLCPQCGSSGAYVFEEGCKKCHYCGYSEC